MTVRASHLRDLVDLQTRVVTQDAMGGLSNTWVTQAQVFAKIRPVAGREDIAGGAAVSNVTHDVRIRWRGDVTAGWRVKLGSRVLNVVSAYDTDQRRREMQLLCEEGAVLV